MIKNSGLIFLVILVSLSCAGCRKVREAFIRPPMEGLEQKSYPIKVYCYQGSVNVKGSPKEVVEGYFKDVRAISRASNFLQIEATGSLTGIDMTELGRWVDYKIHVLSLTFPCRMITIKYRPEREIWWLIVTEGNWLLMRYSFRPVGQGSELSLNVIGQPSKSLAAIMDTLPIIESVGGLADKALAFLQSDMDPELDPKKLTEKGMRGEMYEEFLQAHEASIRVNAGPERTAEWIAENFSDCMPDMRLKGDCAGEQVFKGISPGDVKYCQAGYEFMSFEADLSAFFTLSEEGKETAYEAYMEGLGQFGFLQLEVAPESGGSRVNGKVMIELPGPSAQHIMEMMMTFTDLPGNLEDIIMNIKKGIEGSVGM